MNTTTVAPAPGWLIFAIIGGFLVIFPLFWCAVVWLLSRISGWHRLAQRYASGDRPVTGACYGGITGMVGAVSYRSTLTVHFGQEGFFLEVMPLFRVGQPRLFIPWSEISGRKSRSVLWWRAMALSVGQPAIGSVALPADLVEKYAPAGAGQG